jgi:DUF1680 family protein
VRISLLLLLFGGLAMAAASGPDAFGAAPGVSIARLPLEPDPTARWRFDGELGPRIRANVEQWLLPAPEANPGMLEMFRVRDRRPPPKIVPWAGEFAGKYLISAVQALRMSDSPALRKRIAAFVAELVATQAEDGYLGPFPKAERLRGHWDLWGHYHCMLGLLMWHEATGDATALRCARRAADLVCATYLETDRRVYEAGSHEMNMAVIHGLGRLYRLTGEPRYLRMMREIEKDWERAGDYFRTGVRRVDFYRTPRPRWESLHCLQGLVELYQITGDARYREAFESHWRSIRRWDRRNTGGFSSAEQATGDPYAATPIETCCTIAWMALSVDMLRVTGDALAADELELSTFNAGAGAQHPSGRWWTYSTPMDGTREASAHAIVFQARAGTPELNCCSVNGPRGLGMLSEWAVMSGADGLRVNWYGPGSCETRVDDIPVRLRWETHYPRSGTVLLRVQPERPAAFKLHLRIPGWCESARVEAGGKTITDARPGTYLVLDRRWSRDDAVRLEFDLPLRYVTGDGEAAGRVSLYRGPLLLAYDQAHNPFDEAAIPPVDLKRLGEAKLVSRRPSGVTAPWLLLDLPTAGPPIRLCDYASAGAAGTRYRSWLAAADCPPPPPVPSYPADGAAIPAGPAVFRWSGPRPGGSGVERYELLVSQDPEFRRAVVKLERLDDRFALLSAEAARALSPEWDYYFKVTATGPNGRTQSADPPFRFRVDPQLPPLSAEALRPPNRGTLIQAALRGTVEPAAGKLGAASGWKAVPGPAGEADGAVETDGERGRIIYELDEFPEDEYTLAVRVQVLRFPEGRLGQVASAWTAPSDDPLRLVIDRGRLFARIEAGQGYSTEGVTLEPGGWYNVAAVKRGASLTLYVDGNPAARAVVPHSVRSRSRAVALGANPRYGGNECLAARFAGFSLTARALSPEELAGLFR